MKRKLIHLMVVVALLVSLGAVALPVSVGAAPPPPVANADLDQLVTMGDTVTLDASSSYDLTVPSEALAFQWNVLSGPDTPVFDPYPTAEVVTFTASHGVYQFELEVTAGGATTTDYVTIVAGGATWYVDINGNNANSGTMALPWRTITFAVNNSLVVHGDTIIVGPSAPTRYGGPGAEEHIVVDKAITIMSSPGDRTDTTIDVSGQAFVPHTVVQITPPSLVLDGVVLPGVVLDGFKLTGTGMGVDAWSSDFVEILNNHVVVAGNGFGIGLADCKFPVIDNNLVDVGNNGADFAVGILVTNCLGARVTNNTVNVEVGTFPWGFAAGIIVDPSPHSLIQDNTVTTTVGTDALGYGILVWLSDFVEVLDNIVTVNMIADFYGEAYGIAVLVSDYAKILRNTVDVNASVRADMGGTWAEGIDVWYCDFAEVSNNDVTVYGYGHITAAWPTALDEDLLLQLGPLGVQMAEVRAQRMQGLQGITEELLGVTPEQFGGSTAIGIWVGGSLMPTVHMNVPVDVDAVAVGSVSEPFVSQIMGTALGMGIVATGCDGAQVHHNVVTADANGDLHALTDFWSPSFAYGLGESAGLGIVLLGCPPYVLDVHGLPTQVTPSLVMENSVVANGVLYVEAVATALVLSTQDTDALVPNVQSVLQVVYDIVDQTLEDEAVGGATVGEPQPLFAYSESSGAGIGIGVLTLLSPGVLVIGNNPVDGMGSMVLTSIAVDRVIQDYAEAWGAGLGLGAGIVSMACPGTVIDGNAVTASGFADALVGAIEIPITLYAGGFGGGAGIGLGIIAIADPGAQITNNNVQAGGSAFVIVFADEDLPNQNAEAYGAGIGAGLGIAVVLSPNAVIANNAVVATGFAKVTADAAIITVSDPWAVAFGGGVGAGIGIIAVLSDGVVISDNTVVGIAGPGARGEANVFAYAREDWQFVHDYQEVVVHAGSLGVGLGIVVAMSDNAQVSSSQGEVQEVIARGFATVDSLAQTLVPLEEAWNAGLAAGVGIALAVFLSDHVEVGPCNVLDGAGEAYVITEIVGDPGLQVDVAIAIGLDALFLLCWDSTANYNSLVGVGGSAANVIGIPPEYSLEMVLVIDWGLLNIGPPLDGRYNWWADATGPSGMGPGNGQAVIGPVQYEPWLYVVHTYSIEHHIGKFGFAICLEKCWNTFSVPIALDSRVDTWGELVAFSPGMAAMVGPAVYYDGTQWQPVGSDYQLKPLDGIKVFVLGHTCAILLTSEKDSWPTLPLRKGWNLIGPNPPFCEDGMPVGHAITPVTRADGEGGFSHVISAGAAQPNWIYTLLQWRNGDSGPWMPIGRAYWVWMKTPEILAGFGLTPIELYPCD